MSVNHAVSDLVAMIRNGYLAKRSTISSPISKLREDVLKILKEEGYISSYSKSTDNRKFNINLKYYLSKPVISEIEVISRPGKRIYSNNKDLPLIRNGLGVVVISTSKGVVSDSVARANNIGGELLLKVF